MKKKIPDTAMIEAKPNLFVFVLLIYSKTAFELNLKKIVSTDMNCNKIGSLAVIAEAKGHEAIIRKDS